MSRTIYITETDLERLKALLRNSDLAHHRDRQHYKDLEQELGRAQVVAPTEIPATVVTMNSKVLVKDLVSGEEGIYSIVYPMEADISQGKLSVLAPLGTAILGYKAGDTVEWIVPAGRRRLKIKEILYQPEAAGDFSR